MHPREWSLFKPDEHKAIHVWRARGEYPFARHTHEYYELMLIEHGSGHWLIGDQMGQYRPGDLFLLGPALPHAFYTPLNQQAGLSEPQDNLQILFTFHDEDGGFNGLPELREFAPLFDRAKRGVFFTGACSERLKAQWTLIAHASGVAVLLALLQILHHLFTTTAGTRIASPQYQAAISAPQTHRIDQLCRFLHAHYTDPLTLPRIAEQMNTSIPHLCALFKEYTGQTMLEYIQELRISHACQLLLTSELPISEVAARSGFGSLSNFNRRFQTLRAQSPRDYRKLVRANSGI